VHAAVDALGNPLRFILTPGQRADVSQAEALLTGFKPGAVIGDKGFDSDDFIAHIEALEAKVVIPPKKNRRVQRGVDTNLYADRNKIERFFGRIKHYRRIATRSRENWESRKSYLKRRSTFESIEFGIGLLKLPETERLRLGGRSVPTWYLTDYINLPDAHCGYALLEASQGKVDMLSRSTYSSL
jgi:putative transposase